jgi:cyanophycinase-like exopeptidase
VIGRPGYVILFGSGETSASGRKIYEWLMQRLPSAIRAAVLETPAGFELNSAQVAGRVAEFLRWRLQNYRLQVHVVPARKRGTPFSPDDPHIVAPLVESNVIFLGPGSPTYAVRQLQDSLAWHMLRARHRLGAAIVLASAATIAASAHALPVYEIYKVGEDVHWRPGLDFFGDFGLSLVFIPHWNNAEGGTELDTSHCFMGQSRFEQLLGMLPCDMTVIGIDEHTALVLDLAADKCHVMGTGGITLVRGGYACHIKANQDFPISEFGPFHIPELEAGLSPEVWHGLQSAQVPAATGDAPQPSAEVLALVERRETARMRHDWATADDLRERITRLGWQILDTPQRPRLETTEQGTKESFTGSNASR